MDYRILHRMGGGGFSEVFAVEDPDSALDEVLVLKRLYPEMSVRPAVRAAFSREARTLRRLTHPDVVRFRRCFFDDAGRVCLLMDRAEGETLGTWSRRRAEDVDAHLQLFDRILDAVDYLHHRPWPLLHLDLKPDNILVRETPLGPRPTLIDFGIAREAGENGLKAFTAPYSAPEQQSGGTLGCFTDVHALGHLLANLLEAVDNDFSTARRAALRRVVEKATSPSARQRYADAAEMRRAFRRARTEPAAAPQRPTGQSRWAAGITLALVILIGGAALLFTTGRVGSRTRTAAPADAGSIDRFHRALQQALHSSNHAAIEQHFDDARHTLDTAELSPQTRRRLRDALSEVRRIVNRPVLSASDREAASLWLSEQVSSVSPSEVAP